MLYAIKDKKSNNKEGKTLRVSCKIRKNGSNHLNPKLQNLEASINGVKKVERANTFTTSVPELEDNLCIFSYICYEF